MQAAKRFPCWTDTQRIDIKAGGSYLISWLLMQEVFALLNTTSNLLSFEVGGDRGFQNDLICFLTAESTAAKNAVSSRHPRGPQRKRAAPEPGPEAMRQSTCQHGNSHEATRGCCKWREVGGLYGERHPGARNEPLNAPQAREKCI